MGLLTLHASALIDFQTTASSTLTIISIILRILTFDPQADISKVIEIRDGAEALTKEAIDAKLL